MEEFSLARSVVLLKPYKEKVESQFLYSVLNTSYIQDAIKEVVVVLLMLVYIQVKLKNWKFICLQSNSKTHLQNAYKP
jgi:hypothetical protein